MTRKQQRHIEQPDYVLEVLPRSREILFRRADMDNSQARDALLMFFSIWFRVQMRPGNIDEILTRAPDDWRYIALKVDFTDGIRLDVRQEMREPGRDSGDNPVITHIDAQRKH